MFIKNRDIASLAPIYHGIGELCSLSTVRTFRWFGCDIAVFAYIFYHFSLALLKLGSNKSILIITRLFYIETYKHTLYYNIILRINAQYLIIQEPSAVFPYCIWGKENRAWMMISQDRPVNFSTLLSKKRPDSTKRSVIICGDYLWQMAAQFFH